MKDAQNTRLAKAVDALDVKYPGPGGCCAIVKDGDVLLSHSWGWANTERRIPFTAATPFRICSITKQFTCAALLDLVPDIEDVRGAIEEYIPNLKTAPKIADLCHNQSGLRDYWALAMLCGADPEGVFKLADAEHLIARHQRLQFEPGERSSYSNSNFLLLARAIESYSGLPFADLLRTRLFAKVGMAEADVLADTAMMLTSSYGYEGSADLGYWPAVNRIEWAGDAGIVATLNDLIAWEKYIDATRDDPMGLYNRLSAPPRFGDGALAGYGFGLGHSTILGHKVTGHGGGLRGWRSFRFHAPDIRTSVVVFFNHMADPRAAAVDLFRALLGQEADVPDDGNFKPDWGGAYVEPDTGLLVRMEMRADGALDLRFSQTRETLLRKSEDEFASGVTILTRKDGKIWMARPNEGLNAKLIGVSGLVRRDVEGEFHCDEFAADLVCTTSGGVPYGAFSGRFGSGSMQRLQPIADDIWMLPCPRSLDYPSPGDWTLKFRRSAAGSVSGVTIGCWLARSLEFSLAKAPSHAA